MLPRSAPLARRSPLRSNKPMPRCKGISSRPRERRGPGLAQRVATEVGTALKHQHREPSMMRDLSHRQLVASLPCVACGRQRRSQAAHLNLMALGKGKSLKASDALTVPLCAPEYRVSGCHWILDQSGRLPRAVSEVLQLEWLDTTRTVLDLRGQWSQRAEADYQRIVVPYLLRCA